MIYTNLSTSDTRNVPINMHHLKISSSLETFKGNDDSKDPESFAYDFQKILS
jgi:hypothetical protein